jgi:hypothetical protein
VCGRRFLVYLGAPLAYDGQALEAARERAEQMGARFIDARETPWLICSWGKMLMLVEDVAARTMKS